MALSACAVLLALAVSGVPANDEGERATAPAVNAPAPAGAIRPSAQPIGAPLERWQIDTAQKRPASLPLMYAALGALQAADVFSTARAVGAGASEANPVMRGPSRNTGAMLAVKALSTAGTIYFAERAWKKNRKGAVILMAVINGVTAAVAARNLRNARQ